MKIEDTFSTNIEEIDASKLELEDILIQVHSLLYLESIGRPQKYIFSKRELEVLLSGIAVLLDCKVVNTIIHDNII